MGLGNPPNRIEAEVFIALDNSEKWFGFQLREDNNYPSHLGMLDLLRLAFEHNWTVHIDYRPQGDNGIIFGSGDQIEGLIPSSEP